MVMIDRILLFIKVILIQKILSALFSKTLMIALIKEEKKQKN